MALRSTRRRRLAALGVIALLTPALTGCKPAVVLAACDGTLRASVAGTVGDAELVEVSGLAAGRANPGVIWAHNDSGDGPNLYALDSAGALLATFGLTGAQAIDWEDLAAGPGPVAGEEYLYAADVGDNNALRASVTVYRVPEPAVPEGGAAGTLGVESTAALHLTYPDGPRDAEAVMVDPVTGEIVVVEKRLSGGPVGVYRAPANLAAGSTTALDRVATLDLPFGVVDSVTAADVTADGRAVAIRTYGAVRLYERDTDLPLWSAFLGAACTGVSTAEAQGEAITFESDGRAYVTISEGAHPAVNRFAVPSETTVSMWSEGPGGFFAMPWPSDVRRSATGSIDLTGYPGSDNPLFAWVLGAGSAATDGFGTNSAAFFTTTGPIDTATLPGAVESVDPLTSTALLVDLDHPGAAPVPLLTRFTATGSDLRPANLLALLPYPGHPLEPSTRYAAVLLDGIEDSTGHPLPRSPLVTLLDAAWVDALPFTEAEWDALRDQRDDALAAVGARGRPPEDVIAFTVFTTQDTTGEMEAIAAAVEALPTPAFVTRTAGTCTLPTGRTTVTATLDLPVWQAGARPHLIAGGGIVVGDGGRAVRQGTERVVAKMTFPCGSSPSPSGWPILLWMDGTGGSAGSSSISELGTGTLPYVVASVAPMYSGDRSVSGYAGEDLFFNFANPLAARTNQLQQAADLLYLERVVQAVTLTAAETAGPSPVETRDDTVLLAGHSQGALTLPMAAAFDADTEGVFVSAGGAGFYLSLVHRGDVRAQIDALLGTPAGELDEFHPAVHALQTIAEVGDAANYAPLVSSHVLSVSGVDDGCSPVEVGSALGTALGAGIANPLWHPVFGSAAFEAPEVALPVSGNLPGGRTAVTVQLDTGHFGASTNPSVGRSFVESLAAGATPSVAPGPLLADSTPGCSGRT